jgi:tetraacyldisaccharide 4'-kinase
LVLYLAEALRRAGKRPGIISRGYRGNANGVSEVTQDHDPALVGDESVLLAKRSGCPVFVGRDRVATARALIASHADCDLILSDDGLQHYRLRRDVEIALFDERGLMNARMLPAGPLREPVSRLVKVDALVMNGIAVSPVPTIGHSVFTMFLGGDHFYLLNDPEKVCNVADLAGKVLHAVAGIGSPRRFFDHLIAMGLDCDEHPFEDHYGYGADELAFADGIILTTEKDAVKLARLSLTRPVWVLPVVAEVSPDLAEFVLEKIDGSAPA